MQQRIITAIIALIILVPLIIYGNWPFIVMTTIFALIGLYELMRMFDAKKGILYTVISAVFLLLLLNMQMNFDVKLQTLVIFAIVLFIITVLTKNRFTFQHASFLFLATFYVGIAFYMLLEIRML